MPLIEITHCPLCGSIEHKNQFYCEDYFASKEQFPICDCKQCGFRFTNHFPDEESIGKYYDSPNYISHTDSEKGITNKLYHLVRRMMLRRKVRLVERYAGYNKGTLLDVGCGTGYFLHEADTAGFEVTGVEKSNQARESAISQFHLNIEEELENIDSKRSFNVITLWHVLEHLEKLNESIEKIKSLLTENGTLVVALPNHQSYDAEVYGRHWAAYDVPRHLWHFTPHTVEKLMRKHGLNVVKHYTMPLDAFYISLLSESYKGHVGLLRYPKAFLTGTVGYFLSLRKLQKSSSVIYIIKK